MASLAGRSSPPVMWFVLAVVLFGGVGAWSLSAVDRGAGRPPTSGDLPSDLFEGPFPGGFRATLSDAEKAVDFPVLLPDSPEANSSVLADVWTDSSDDIALVYAGDITIAMWPSAYKDPASGLQTVVDTTTAKAYLVQVGDSPGVAIEPNTAPGTTNPAWVEFVRDGVDVNLWSKSQSVETLLSVANTMSSPV